MVVCSVWVNSISGEADPNSPPVYHGCLPKATSIKLLFSPASAILEIAAITFFQLSSGRRTARATDLQVQFQAWLKRLLSSLS
jgi:hypothetical protein